jgi:hypothetical protein
MEQIEYHYYFFDENLTSLDPQDLNSGPRIFKVKPDLFFNYPLNADGPYNSVRGLKKNSKRFLIYRGNNNKRATKICEEKWIKEISNQGIVSPLGKGYPEEFMRSIEHITIGKITKTGVSGIHYADQKRVKILEKSNENFNGVFAAKFQILDHKTNEWHKKEGSSTFFPANWSLDKLFHECAYAYFDYRKELIDGQKFKYLSKTKSGVDVIIVIRSNKVKTIYPIL